MVAESTKMNTNQLPHLSCVWSEPHNWDTLNANIDVPDEPGYYAFTDYADILQPSANDKNVLYVGIATQSLRDRIKKYKLGDTTGLMGLHRGGFLLMLSRGVAHASAGRVTHSVQRTPVEVIVRPTATKPGDQRFLMPDAIYLRWAVDYRAAIEALLIQQLCPKYNTMFVQQ
jgi:hypothetical protein